MVKYEIDKRIGIVILFLILLLILNGVIGYVVYPMIFSIGERGDYTIRKHMISNGALAVMFLGRIVVGIWLNQEAKRLRRSRFIWTTFGIFFGLSAAFLFYLIEIYNELILLRRQVHKLSK